MMNQLREELSSVVDELCYLASVSFDPAGEISLNPIRVLRDLAMVYPFFAASKYDRVSTDFLVRHLRKGYSKENVNLSEYQIFHDLQKQNSMYGRKSEKWFDSSFGFDLYFGEETIAVIGFEFVDSYIPYVTQIQGVQGRKQELNPFRWETMLLRTVVNWSAQHGLKEVRTRPAEFNHWARDRRMKMDQAKRFYDATPRMCGFRKVDVPEEKIRNGTTYYYSFAIDAKSEQS